MTKLFVPVFHLTVPSVKFQHALTSETQQYVIVEEKSLQKLYELLLQPAKFFQ